MGIKLEAVGVRFSDNIQYTSICGPTKVRAEHTLDEVVGSSTTGSVKEVGAVHVNGPDDLDGAS